MPNIAYFCSENPLYGPLFGAVRQIRDSRGAGLLHGRQLRGIGPIQRKVPRNKLHTHVPYAALTVQPSDDNPHLLGVDQFGIG